MVSLFSTQRSLHYPFTLSKTNRFAVLWTPGPLCPGENGRAHRGRAHGSSFVVIASNGSRKVSSVNRLSAQSKRVKKRLSRPARRAPRDLLLVAAGGREDLDA